VRRSELAAAAERKKEAEAAAEKIRAEADAAAEEIRAEGSRKAAQRLEVSAVASEQPSGDLGLDLGLASLGRVITSVVLS